MKKPEIVVSRKPGKISIDNFSEAEEYINACVKPFAEVKNKYRENIPLARHDKRMLLKLKSEVDSSVKEAIAVYSEPLEKMKFDILKLYAIIDSPLSAADSAIENCEQSSRDKAFKNIKEFFFTVSACLGDYAVAVFESPAFVEDNWLKSPSLSLGTQNAVISKIEKACSDITVICSSSRSFTPVMLAKFFETLSLDDVESFKDRILCAANGSFSGSVTSSEKHDFGKSVLTLDCDESGFYRTLKWLKLADIDFSVDSFSFASYLKEHKLPDFDSFVALDIETTGSLGASHGDKPAEITEIGAVKVENGVVTDKFSMLANPGRKITAPVIRLTHITDEMVKNQPPVCEVVRKFAEFAGDSILVGHGIGFNDLPFICRTAQKIGIKLENEYFDTCELASSMKEKFGWQRIRLEYLSSLFGIVQNNAHRAWCDAEANAEVYFRLKALSGK